MNMKKLGLDSRSSSTCKRPTANPGKKLLFLKNYDKEYSIEILESFFRCIFSMFLKILREKNLRTEKH